MKRVLVTGATGFIGSRVLSRLTACGFDVVAAGRTPPSNSLRPLASTWITADLTTAGGDIVRSERPTHILHLAWDTRHGLYWTSPENLRWVAATADMMVAFAAIGGARFVMSGSCAEYDWTWRGGDFDEAASPLKPATLYGWAKKTAGELLLASGEQLGFGAAVGRVFFCYGEGEHPDRLVSYVCRQLVQHRTAELTSGVLVRDFMHVDDVASGLVALLDSPVTGAVNIASGEGRSLRHIAETAGRLAGAPSLVRLGARPDRPDDPPRIVGSSARLRATGWSPAVPLEQGVASLLASFA